MNRNFARCMREDGTDFYVCYECEFVGRTEFDIEYHMRCEHPSVELKKI